MPDVSLYLVTEPMVGLDDMVAAAVAGGVVIVQLRDKRATTRGLTSVATRLRQLTASRGVPLIVNDDVEAARAAHGVHVGTSDVLPLHARHTLGPDAIVGWSINDLSQLDDVTQLDACSYVAVSPVFATSTKPDHEPPWGLAGLRAVRARTRLPVVAIGGIDEENAADVIRAGADGVAVVSAISRALDPFGAAQRLRTVVGETADLGERK